MTNGTTVQMISTVVLSWKLADLRALRLAVLEDRIEHHAEHADEDQRADQQHEVVQPLLVAADRGDRRVQVDLVDRRAARQVVDARAPTPLASAAPRPAGLTPPTACHECCDRLHDCHSVQILVDSGWHRRPAAGRRARAASAAGPSAARRPAAAAVPAARSGRPRCGGPGPTARSASDRRARGSTRTHAGANSTCVDAARRWTRRTVSAPGRSRMRSRSVAWRAYTSSAAPTASSSSRRTASRAARPASRTQPAIASDSDAERQVEGEQLARRERAVALAAATATEPSPPSDSRPKRSGAAAATRRPGAGE